MEAASERSNARRGRDEAVHQVGDHRVTVGSEIVRAGNCAEKFAALPVHAWVTSRGLIAERAHLSRATGRGEDAGSAADRVGDPPECPRKRGRTNR